MNAQSSRGGAPKRPVPGDLSVDEAAAIARKFNVAMSQVRRDHFISHALGALSLECPDELLFFGGTALSRTHLPASRLSEDIDLITYANRGQVATKLESALPRHVRRTHGRAEWDPPFSHREVTPAIIRVGGISVRVQLLSSKDYAAWPTESRRLEQRYSDAPPARLTVPTLESFIGWKTAAWHDRHAPRDLHDLWALAESGAFNDQAAELFAKHGNAAGPPRSFMFTTAPSEDAWRAALANQCQLTISAAQALKVVRREWARVIGPDWD